VVNRENANPAVAVAVVQASRGSFWSIFMHTMKNANPAVVQ
jgi:hypothetical protein